MKCVFCHSPRVLRFVDAFGERRVFCRGCGRSIIEEDVFELKKQKNLQDFVQINYLRPCDILGR